VSRVLPLGPDRSLAAGLLAPAVSRARQSISGGELTRHVLQSWHHPRASGARPPEAIAAEVLGAEG
jgi:hypothetical protein